METPADRYSISTLLELFGKVVRKGATLNTSDNTEIDPDLLRPLYTQLEAKAGELRAREHRAQRGTRGRPPMGIDARTQSLDDLNSRISIFQDTLSSQSGTKALETRNTLIFLTMSAFSHPDQTDQQSVSKELATLAKAQYALLTSEPPLDVSSLYSNMYRIILKNILAANQAAVSVDERLGLSEKEIAAIETKIRDLTPPHSGDSSRDDDDTFAASVGPGFSSDYPVLLSGSVNSY